MGQFDSGDLDVLPKAFFLGWIGVLAGAYAGPAVVTCFLGPPERKASARMGMGIGFWVGAVLTLLATAFVRSWEAGGFEDPGVWALGVLGGSVIAGAAGGLIGPSAGESLKGNAAVWKWLWGPAILIMVGVALSPLAAWCWQVKARMATAEYRAEHGDVNGLLAMLQNGNESERGSAARALWAVDWNLGRPRDPRIAPALMKALKDPSLIVRGSLVDGLRSLPDASGVPLLREAMKDSSAEVRLVAVQCTMGWGDGPWVPLLSDALAHALKDSNPLTRWLAAMTLGSRGDKRAIPALKEALKSGDKWFARRARAALIRLGCLPRPPIPRHPRAGRKR
jgi:hypothetical protein